MSEMTLFDGNLPSHLKNRELDDDTKALMGGSGTRTHRLSLKGNIFRMMVNGEEVSSIDDRKMNVVFVKFATKPSRNFYQGQYKEGLKTAPTCWSRDGETPDSSVEEPQSNKCETCPQNIKGSSNDGESRACKFNWRTAVALQDDLEGEIYQLTLPASSCFGKGEKDKWPFKQYGQFLGSNNIPMSAVVTEMKFDSKSPVPKVTFRPVAALSEEDYDLVRSRSNDPVTLRAINMTVAQADKPKFKKEMLEHNPKPQKIEETSAEDIVVEEPKPVKKANKKAEAEKAVQTKKPITSVLSKWADEEDDD